MNKLLKIVFILTLIFTIQSSLSLGVIEAASATKTSTMSESDTKTTTEKYVKGNTTITKVTTVVTTTDTSS